MGGYSPTASASSEDRHAQRFAVHLHAAFPRFQSWNGDRCRERCLGRTAPLSFATMAFVALVASGPAFATRGSLQRLEVLVTEMVRSHQLGEATGHCPTSHPYPVGPDFSYVRGGGVPGSAALMASYPLPRRRWFTEIANLTNKPQRLNIGVVCLRANATFAYPLERGWVVPPNGYGGGSSQCPRSAPHAIDNYFGIQGSVHAGSLLLADTYPFTSGKVEGFETGVENRTTRVARIFAGSVCTSLPSQTSYVRDKVGPEKHSDVAVRCPPQTPLALSGTFYALPPAPSRNPNDGKIALGGTTPYKRTAWAIGVTSLTHHAVRDVVGAVCIGQ
jgi:hypothetical protein